jgi:hypothetical protein
MYAHQDIMAIVGIQRYELAKLELNNDWAVLC